ncbi:hypothetical protein AB0C59_22535 [Streptomyces sp. NPDC048664]|uniref:hypothetical protein n=1 Tax=Streptomyces sp. NPDC048664 TaxID=3154505 RepID=UPI00344444BD
MTTQPSSGPTVHPREVLRLLRLPGIASGLSADQIRGADCVWCATKLSAESAVDFGLCSGALAGVVSAWFPRACEECVCRVLRDTYDRHPQSCASCASDPNLCDARRALRRAIPEEHR